MLRKEMCRQFSVALIGLAMATSAVGADSIPTYPNATNNLQGVPLNSGMTQLTTSDTAEKVDAWYGAHLPKTCKREAAKGGSKYACPGTNVMITPNSGTTLITQMAAGIGGR